MRNRISIVIPFFQSNEGILIKAVNSALKQTGIGEPEIIIVDDASPVSARRELESIIRDYPGRITIIEQPNGGPAAARNKGLDHVREDSEYVAFLDSDDEWTDLHLSNALDALEHGYDFYFSDFYQLDQTVSAFNRAKRIKIDEHRKILPPSNLHEYNGEMLDQILRGNIIGTPTVVYRYRKFSQLRFREEFVYAGEDYLFWLEISTLTNRIVFSSDCETVCGRGVNVFSGSGWGTENSLIRTHQEMKYRKAVTRLFKLSHQQRVAVHSAIKQLRETFVHDILHRIVRRKSIDLTLVRDQLRIDPLFIIYLFPIVIKLALARARVSH